MVFFSLSASRGRAARAPFPLPGAPLPSPGRPALFALALLTLFALALRLHGLGDAHLWWDEYATLSRAALSPAEMWSSLAAQAPNDARLDSSPPLLHALVHGLLALGVRDSWIKIPSAVFGAASVSAIGLLGCALFGRVAGVAAALVLACNMYHIAYSRELRPYSLYLLCALWSLWFLLKARSSGRARHWAAYALCVAAMFYASYLAAATLAGQGVFVAVDWLASRNARPGARRAYLSGFVLSCLAALALYLPWLPGHLYHLRLVQGMASGLGAPVIDGASFFKEYAAQGLQAPFPLAWAGVALAAGLAAAAFRNWRGALLFVSWVGMSLGFTVVARFVGVIPARYLISGVILLALAAGVLADFLAGLAPRFVAPGARAAAALSLAVLVCLPGLMVYPSACRPPYTEIEALAAWLRGNPDNVDALMFHRNHHQKVTMAWLVPHLYGRLGDAPDEPYLRCYLVSEDGAAATTPPVARLGHLSVHRQGVLRQAPVVLDRPYREDFTTTRFYEDAADWRNAGPDTGWGDLTLYDPSRRGFAVYRFQAPQGGFASGMLLECRLRLTRSAGVPAPDAAVGVTLTGAGTAPVVARVVTQADFPGTDAGGRDVTLRFALPPDLAGAGELTLRFDFDPGTRHGQLDLASFALDWPGGETLPGGLEIRFANLAAGGALRAWTPGVARAGERSVYAFSLDDARAAPCLPLGLENAAARMAFEREWPGLAPVAVWPGAGGEPAVAVYDTALDHAWLPAGRRVLSSPNRVECFKAEGLTEPVELDLGSGASPLAAALPGKARLAARGNGPSLVRLEMTDVADALGQAHMAEHLDADTAGAVPCLRCRTGDGCFAVYAFRLPAPARRVRILYHPFVSRGGARPNELAFSLSTDGNAYRRVAAFAGPRLLAWDEGGRMSAEAVLDRPSRLVYVRLEMTSEESTLRVSPLTPFALEIETDAAWPLPENSGGSVFTPLTDGPDRARVFFSGGRGAK